MKPHLVEHQEDEENDYEKEQIEKMISSIPPLTKGTKHGLAKQCKPMNYQNK
jgi:hypothetical protein